MGPAPRTDPTTRWFVMQLMCLDAPSRGGGAGHAKSLQNSDYLGFSMASASWGLPDVCPSLVLLLPIMGELPPPPASVGSVTTDLMLLLLPLNAP